MERLGNHLRIVLYSKLKTNGFSRSNANTLVTRIINNLPDNSFDNNDTLSDTLNRLGDSIKESTKHLKT
jgi:hypothetical protein